MATFVYRGPLLTRKVILFAAVVSATLSVTCETLERIGDEVQSSSLATTKANALLPRMVQASSESQQIPDKAKPSSGDWFYRMYGNLDAANLSCTARAHVSAATSGEARCMNWELTGLKCKGSRDADWIHEDDTKGEICKTQQKWELKNDLPGQAFCVPTVTEARENQATSFRLECTWKCRTGADPCAGTATYEFSSTVFPTGVRKHGTTPAVISHP